MTRLITLDRDAIKEASTLIMSGKIVAYPTDTVYGLGCDPYNDDAVQRLISAKERTQGQLPLLVDSLERADRIGRFDAIARDLAMTFWPGPLTLILPSKDSFPSAVMGPTNTVGLRVPARGETIDFIRSSGGVIVGTSANISGRSAGTTAQEVLAELNGRIELVLDGGPSSTGIESTVVEIVSGRVSILRAKAIGSDQILAAVQNKTRA